MLVMSTPRNGSAAVASSAKSIPPSRRQAHDRTVFLPEEDRPGKAAYRNPELRFLATPVWRRSKGAGKVAPVNGERYAVVGVMSSGFSLSYEVVPTVSSVPQPDLLLPLPISANDMASQGDENYNLVGRLKPGASIGQAQSELDLYGSTPRTTVSRRLSSHPPSSALPQSLCSIK